MKISVVICTHNPRADYLERTLDSIRQQRNPGCDWELLFVDNASSESHSYIVELARSSGRYVREEKLGLVNARMRAIEETTGELLVFIDDDNVLAPSYLSEVFSIAQCHPELGVFGAGNLIPEFESKPPRHILPHVHLLALRRNKRIRISSDLNDHSSIPFGAGLCVQRSIANYYYQLLRNLDSSEVIGRRGKRLFCGEDDIISYVAVYAGLNFGIFPQIEITHLIDKSRISKDYIMRLVESHAYSHGVINFILKEHIPLRPKFIDYLKSLSQVRHGLFAANLKFAHIRGKKLARSFIFDNHLSPIDLASLL